MNDQQREASQLKVADLKDAVEEFVQVYRKRHRSNFHANWVLILSGLLLSAAVTVAGILNQGIIAAVLGVSIALVIGVQNAFPMGEKGEFYRLIVAEGENLISDLEFGRIHSEAEFEAALDTFQKLRKHTAASLPRGQGMDAVKDMYKDLSKTVDES